MRSTLTVAVLLAACFNSLASAGDSECTTFAQMVPLCAVLSDAANYGGKEITVKGLYRMVIHGSILMEPACSKALVNMRDAADYRADKHALAVIRSLTKKDQFRSVAVVLRGTFRVAHEGQCFGQMCEPYEIQVDELLCAEKSKSDSNGNTQNVEP
jgi:hypothetical protein